MLARLTVLGCIGLLAACGTAPVTPSAGHIMQPPPAPAGSIPEPVRALPVLPKPQPATPAETYTIVVHDVPVRDLLYALARDVGIDVDIHPEVSGQVSLNAIDQTLEHLLKRIARQVDMRYAYDDDVLVITPDRPYVRTYPVDYVNMSRLATGRVGIRSTVGSTGSVVGDAANPEGGNESSFGIDLSAHNDFWNTLAVNLMMLLGEPGGATDAAPTPGAQVLSPDIIVNRESGLIAVRATARQHERVREFLDDIMASARRQVLIEATIVEVELNDDYQGGVDWSLVHDGSTSIAQNLLGGELLLPPSFRLDVTRLDTGIGSLSASIRALSKFGNTRVLSSPRLMVLNNQSAVLKVVDEVVYFEIGREVTEATLTSARRTEFTTTIRTAPVGVVIMVTPHISAGDVVSLNVRPTVSRIVDFRADPTARTFGDGIDNLIPEIQVREMESILRIPSGRTAVLGGLMQDDVRNRSAGLPGASRIPVLGNLFSFRDDTSRKSELIVFLRPIVIRNADVSGDLAEYRRYLPQAEQRLDQREGLYPLGPAARDEWETPR